MWSFPLLAQAREDPLRSPEVIWGVAGLTVALLVGAVVIYAVDQWRKRAAAGPTASDASDALTEYRALYESGEITEEEYAKLRDKVAAKVKAPPAAPKPPAPPVDGTRPPPPSFRPAPPDRPAEPPPSGETA